jgi:hypothetical protein
VLQAQQEVRAQVAVGRRMSYLRSLLARVHPLIAALLALVAAVGVTVAVTAGPDGRPTVKIITAPTRSGKAVQAPLPQVEAAANGAEDAHLGAGADTRSSAGSSDRANPQAPRIDGPVPLASAHQAGCVSRFNRYNYSYRTGIRPSVGTLHLPVAHNVPGWGDVSGVHIFLDRPATAASANYENDDEGHCIYSVPETLKAWAQANGNSATACAVEQQAYGNEPRFFDLNGPGLRQLARIFHDCFKRWGIKIQRGLIGPGCRVIREGLVDHNAWGACGGGHVDVHGFGAQCRQQGASANTSLCVDVVVAAMKALDGPKPPTARQRAKCHALNTIRRRAARTGKWTPKGRADRIKAAERAHHVRCRLKAHPHLVRR